MISELYNESIGLLKQLIATPSFSREEDATALLLETFLRQKNIETHRVKNNIWCRNRYFDESRPSLLLNSHHDTVKPNLQYTRDPFSPHTVDGKLYGLGSNDAGGSLVALIATFLHFYDKQDLKYNIMLAISAEEEISGREGIELLLPHLGTIDFAIVGEPTLTNLAIAEKGLLVIDCTAHGRAGHAARNEGENAVYKALKDIEWLNSFRFPKVSPLLGPVKMSVTVINTENKAHNVVPASCSFVADVRVTDAYTLEEVLETIRRHISSDLKPRSLRMRSSSIAIDHPIVLAGKALGKTTYGSPTTSDQALIPFPSLKCGPGDSARSHTADEFIYLHEVEAGIDTYIKLLNDIL
ncbi:MAG: M20 family metallo-hydrolase [Chitinophagaceae bacterium]|nr:M20 family metallo-hydrolase [Chitinophagaceae bacterium]